jgi:hypothetical protein
MLYEPVQSRGTLAIQDATQMSDGTSRQALPLMGWPARLSKVTIIPIGFEREILRLRARLDHYAWPRQRDPLPRMIGIALGRVRSSRRERNQHFHNLRQAS